MTMKSIWQKAEYEEWLRLDPKIMKANTNARES